MFLDHPSETETDPTPLWLSKGFHLWLLRCVKSAHQGFEGGLPADESDCAAKARDYGMCRSTDPSVCLSQALIQGRRAETQAAAGYESRRFANGKVRSAKFPARRHQHHRPRPPRRSFHSDLQEFRRASTQLPENELNRHREFQPKRYVRC